MRRALLLIFLGYLSTNFVSGIGYTVSCSSIPEAAGSCDQCFHFDLGSSNSPSDNFVPRTGIASGSYEFIYTAQSSITGTTYQGATVTPTGNITNLFNLTERGVANNSWTWASMKSGNAITKGTVPTTIDIGRPIYLLKFTTLSGIKDINNVIQSGQDVTHRECAFYYQTAPTAFCGNGNREGTEQCDDGNTINTDACSNTCTNNTICGNGTREGAEQCDDGNTINTDACSNTCTTNSVGACGTQNNNSVYDQSSGTALVASTSGLCASGAVASFLYSPSQNRWTWSCAGSNNGASPSCQANRTYCGNGTIESTEQCDDGNTNNNDGCNTSCRIATIPSPAIRIYKDDADNRDDRQTITSGTRPRFTITVINYGNVDLRDVVVTDQRAPGCDKTIGTLVRNDSKTYTCEGSATTASFTNTARATGRSITDTTVVSDDDTTEVTVGATAISCTVGASNKSGYAPLQTTLTCSGSPSGKTVMAIKKNGATLELINASSKNYTFNNIGSYTVVCYPDGSQQNQGNACTTTIQVGSLCGNRKVEGAEQCDDGNTRGGDGCNQYCEIEYKIQPICGNGKLEGSEECDDGNRDNNDSCSNICLAPTCGNGLREGNEQCDDGNMSNKDSCSNICRTIELTDPRCRVEALDYSGPAPFSTSLLCTGEPRGRTFMVIERGGKTISTIETGNRNYTFTKSGTYTVTCYPDSSPENHRNLCRTTVEVGGQCGNGVVENGEQCDDGNTISGDACNRFCRINGSSCGNGYLDRGEQCDDGNNDSGDYCTNICQRNTPDSGPLGMVAVIFMLAVLGGAYVTYRRYHI